MASTARAHPRRTGYQRSILPPRDTGFGSGTPASAVGFGICWDHGTPAARAMALQGAECCSTPPPSAGAARLSLDPRPLRRACRPCGPTTRVAYNRVGHERGRGGAELLRLERRRRPRATDRRAGREEEGAFIAGSTSTSRSPPRTWGFCRDRAPTLRGIGRQVSSAIALPTSAEPGRVGWRRIAAGGRRGGRRRPRRGRRPGRRGIRVGGSNTKAAVARRAPSRRSSSARNRPRLSPRRGPGQIGRRGRAPARPAQAYIHRQVAARRIGEARLSASLRSMQSGAGRHEGALALVDLLAAIEGRGVEHRALEKPGGARRLAVEGAPSARRNLRSVAVDRIVGLRLRQTRRVDHPRCVEHQAVLDPAGGAGSGGGLAGGDLGRRSPRDSLGPAGWSPRAAWRRRRRRSVWGAWAPARAARRRDQAARARPSSCSRTENPRLDKCGISRGRPRRGRGIHVREVNW